MIQNSHESEWNDESKDCEEKDVQVVEPEVPVPVVDGAHCAARLIRESAHQAHRGRGCRHEGQEPEAIQ